MSHTPAPQILLILTFGALDGCSAPTILDGSSVERQAWLAQPVAPLQDGICKPLRRQLLEGQRCGARIPNLSSSLTGVGLAYRHGGFAGRDVDDSGYVLGTHFSGDPSAPMVTEEKGCVSESCVRTLWQSATGLYLEVVGGILPTQPEVQEGISVTMERKSGKSLSVNWQGSSPSGNAERVVNLINEMDIGYW